ncbi:MAG: molecular chaperone DnaJ [Acidobacteria bacterium]|nr:molecular chaperone DnaJ [Acidobacteriota bacterium]
MSTLILSQQSEEHELQRRREELAQLETSITERETQLAGVKVGLSAFEVRYLTVVGNRYDELAKIEKQIAKLQGLEFDENYDGDSLADDEVGCGQNRLHTDKLKKLYKEVARKFHPDLASCPQERQHRHQLMIEVNHAYESGAEEKLQELLEAGASLEAVEMSGARSAEMILLLRKIAEAQQRLNDLESEIAETTASEIYKLKLRVETAEVLEEDLFADLVLQVDRQIKKAQNRLFHLQLIYQDEIVEACS